MGHTHQMYGSHGGQGRSQDGKLQEVHATGLDFQYQIYFSGAPSFSEIFADTTFQRVFLCVFLVFFSPSEYICLVGFSPLCVFTFAWCPSSFSDIVAHIVPKIGHIRCPYNNKRPIFIQKQTSSPVSHEKYAVLKN